MYSNSQLDHAGVKGMKWGVRKNPKKSSLKTIRKDRKFEQKAVSNKMTIKLYNEAAGRANKEIGLINKKYEGKDLSYDSPTRRQYYKDHQNNLIKHLKDVAKEQGTNASGTREMSIRVNPDNSWEVETVSKNIKQSSMNELRYKVVPITNAMGRIISLKILAVDSVLMQGLIFSGNDIFHVGVKGMKWGVRKAGARKLAAVKKNRKLNKASRAKDRAEFEKEVDEARGKVFSGQLRRDLASAKKEAKAKKSEIGSREARKIVAKQKKLNEETRQKASQFKNGKEAAAGLLIVIGTDLVSSRISSRDS
jgi:hypothetical protein